MKKTIEALWKTDARLTVVGLAMMALLAATAVALLIDPREIAGAPAWMKPAKFAASMAIYTLTLAWVFTYLPEWTGTRRVVSWVTAVTLVLEIVIIDVQAWRGTTSHFNVGTVVDGVLFSIIEEPRTCLPIRSSPSRILWRSAAGSCSSCSQAEHG